MVFPASLGGRGTDDCGFLDHLAGYGPGGSKLGDLAPVGVGVAYETAEAGGRDLAGDLVEHSVQGSGGASGSGPDAAVDEQSGGSYGVEQLWWPVAGVVTERRLRPVVAGLDPTEAFQTGSDIARHVPGVAGVPQQDGVGDRGVRVGEAQGDPADVLACPDVVCSVDAQVAGVQTEPRQGADPGVDELEVFADLRDRHHAGEVDERGQESRS